MFGSKCFFAGKGLVKNYSLAVYHLGKNLTGPQRDGRLRKASEYFKLMRMQEQRRVMVNMYGVVSKKLRRHTKYVLYF